MSSTNNVATVPASAPLQGSVPATAREEESMPDDTISFKLDKSLHTGDTIYLQADTQKYLSRMGPTGIEASKDGIDAFCAFTVTVVSPTEIALQADTKKYLSRMGATGILASKDGIDPFCRFRVRTLTR